MIYQSSLSKEDSDSAHSKNDHTDDSKPSCRESNKVVTPRDNPNWLKNKTPKEIPENDFSENENLEDDQITPRPLHSLTKEFASISISQTVNNDKKEAFSKITPLSERNSIVVENITPSKPQTKFKFKDNPKPASPSDPQTKFKFKDKSKTPSNPLTHPNPACGYFESRSFFSKKDGKLTPKESFVSGSTSKSDKSKDSLFQELKEEHIGQISSIENSSSPSMSTVETPKSRNTPHSLLVKELFPEDSPLQVSHPHNFDIKKDNKEGYAISIPRKTSPSLTTSLAKELFPEDSPLKIVEKDKLNVKGIKNSPPFTSISREKDDNVGIETQSISLGRDTEIKNQKNPLNIGNVSKTQTQNAPASFSNKSTSLAPLMANRSESKNETKFIKPSTSSSDTIKNFFSTLNRAREKSNEEVKDGNKNFTSLGPLKSNEPVSKNETNLTKPSTASPMTTKESFASIYKEKSEKPNETNVGNRNFTKDLAKGIDATPIKSNQLSTKKLNPYSSHLKEKGIPSFASPISMPSCPRALFTPQKPASDFLKVMAPGDDRWKQTVTAQDYRDHRLSSWSNPLSTPQNKTHRDKIPKSPEVIKELFESLHTDIEIMDLPLDDLKVTLFPHQKSGVSFMVRQEKNELFKGGILADDMGLGKTVQSIALILSNASKKNDCKTTLIVGPLALIKQWEAEIHEKVNSSTLKVCVYHGSRRVKFNSKLGDYDVVITTYHTLHSNGYCFNHMKWYRVILDEAHSIKNHNTKLARACFALNSEFRWCITGTPIQNKMEELYSLIHFLRIQPYCEFHTFKKDITDSTKDLSRLRVFLRTIMIRREKATIDVNTGKQLVKLPPKISRVVKVQLTPTERLAYINLERWKDRTWAKLEKKSVIVGLIILLRLRQACCHISLVGNTCEDEEEVMQITKEKSDSGLDALLEDLNNMSIERKCELCGRRCSEMSKILTVCSECYETQLSSPDIIPDIKTYGEFQTSSKIEKLMEILIEANKDPDSKTIVFSQFTSMLNLITIPLEANGIEFCRYQGDMNPKQREESINELKFNPNVRVMLISLMCGSLGLNLIAANRVILVDPWWNPAIEDQATDRVYRIGQTKKVEVIRLITSDSLEESVAELQERKREIANSALSGNMKKNITLQDLNILFG